MKRGFLKKATNTTGPTGIKIAQAPKEPQYELIPIPEIKIPNYDDAPIRGKFPDSLMKTGFNVVTLPRPSIFRLMERVAVCLLFPGTKEKILALPNFPSPLITPPNPLQSTYSIRDVDGYGKGMFANVKIQPGELIICERPLIVFPGVLPYGRGVTIHPDTLLEQMVNALSDESRKLFYALHNCKGASASSRIRGILDTNSLDIGGLPGDYDGTHAAVCPAISRINHNCTPNAEHQWHLESLSYHVRALRTIERGEQIFISYSSTLFEPRRQRQNELLSKYGFTCACLSCSLPKQESARSDIQRSVLLTATLKPATAKDDHEVIKAWAADPKLPDDHIIKHSLKIVDLMAAEGLYEKKIWLVHYTRLCKAYCALGDREAAKKWAEKSAVMAIAFTGDDRGWNKVAATPERTEWWGLRKKALK